VQYQWHQDPVQPSTPVQLNSQLDAMLMQEQLQQQCNDKIRKAEKDCNAAIEAERVHMARMEALRNLRQAASPNTGGSFPSTPRP